MKVYSICLSENIDGYDVFSGKRKVRHHPELKDAEKHIKYLVRKYKNHTKAEIEGRLKYCKLYATRITERIIHVGDNPLYIY